MAQGKQYDEQGNLIDDLAAPVTGGNLAPAVPGVGDAFGVGTAEPAPAPSSGTPQQMAGALGAGVRLPEFGMGGMNMPPAPTFDQPSDESLTQTGGNGLSGDDQTVRSQAGSIFGSDPGTPGGRYSGGYGRKANPLRETDIGKRFAGASKAGTAYGNAFDKEGLLGGGKNAQLAGGDNAELGSQPSDLLLQMLQLLGQQG